jgi:hypothetical protein
MLEGRDGAGEAITVEECDVSSRAKPKETAVGKIKAFAIGPKAADDEINTADEIGVTATVFPDGVDSEACDFSRVLDTGH